MKASNIESQVGSKHENLIEMPHVAPKEESYTRHTSLHRLSNSPALMAALAVNPSRRHSHTQRSSISNTPPFAAQTDRALIFIQW